MSFGTGHLDDPQAVAGGERYGLNILILTALAFEDGLKFGRFAKLDSASLDNMDGSANPVVAGVVLRNVANAVEDAATIDSDLYSQVEYLRRGLVAVDVKSGETPAMFGQVYVSNAGDANDGLATATLGDVEANAEFIREIQTNVWLVNLSLSELDAPLIADPGNAGAIPANLSGNVAITTAAAETRTLAIPTIVGLKLVISFDVDVGDAVITVASAVNQAGNAVMTMADAGDIVVLESVQVAGSPVWRLTANDGAALT